MKLYSQIDDGFIYILENKPNTGDKYKDYYNDIKNIGVISSNEKNVRVVKSIGKKNKAIIGITDINFSKEIIKRFDGGDVIG